MTGPAPIIIAIPARKESDRIGAALAALAAQPDAAARIAGVIILANNCTDATASVARATPLPFELTVIEVEMPPGSHIGHVRRTVTDAASAQLATLGGTDGIVASTDADSRVAPDWLAALHNAFTADIEAVCGTIELDGPIDAAVAAARRIEAEYADAVARATAHLDPLPHDPWPNHIWSWGANFAVRARALAAVGGSPLVDLAEDRALHAALIERDIPVRHSTAVRVHTSARHDGRAPGGFADLLAGYGSDPAILADFNLEPATAMWARAAARGDARRRWGPRPGFGAAWAAQEAATPRLARQRVALADLPAQTRLLDRRLKAATGRSGNRARAVGE